MKIVRCFCLITGLLFVSGLFGQRIEKFSNTREEFYNELSRLFESVHSKTYQQKAEDLLEKFYPKWMSDRFKNEEKDEIIFVSNTMLAEDMRPFPHFYDFLAVLTEIAYTTQNKESVIAWLRSLDPLIRQRSSTGFMDYLEQSMMIIKHGYLYESGTMAWRFDNEKFAFYYDTVPSLQFERLDLICTTGKDSSVIEKTQGVFYLTTEEWFGKGGMINWNRVGLDEDKVHAEILCHYRVNCKETDYSIDSVKFVNKFYFREPILGRLDEQVFSGPPGKRTSYPRFESFYKGFMFKNIFPDIDFEGGIAMEGAKIIGSGSDWIPALLTFYRNDSLFARIKSKAFVIQEDKINSARAAISLYFQGDSIYHPGLNMKYVNNDRELTLYRSGKGLAQSPFYDSYHNVDMYCEALYWKLNEDNINFEMIRGISRDSKATFESANYYSDYDYYKLQGIDPINPLDVVKNYAERYKTEVIRLNSFTRYINKPVEQASALLFNLTARGFLVYDVDEKKATVKQRLYDYLDAKAGLTDYDVIRFVSETVLKSNAELDITNFDLKINGVSEIFLSDSQNVAIYPYREEIIMKKNRDFMFSGRVRVRFFDFFVKDGIFEYDTFRLNLPVIDSLSFFVKTDSTDVRGNHLYTRVHNVIADLSGELFIDHPNNKSGRNPSEDYPIFNSLNESFVYYDYKNIKDGVYDRERFYFHVDPFTIKQLDEVTTNDLQFKGYLASSGIFPFIKEPLVVLPDFSLGFKHTIPEVGYPVYDEKGRYFEKLTLNNDGLFGEGNLKYLSSSSESQRYNFYLDSLHAKANLFDVTMVDTGVEFPAVQGEIVDQFWLPDTNVMYVTMIENPFMMYNNNSEFRGQIILSPDGMVGNGRFNFAKAEIESRLFDFAHASLVADTSDFRLLTATESGLAISTNDYRSMIDFDKREGRFETTGKLSIVDFPFNKYISSMDELLWSMDEQKITLINNMNRRIPYLEDLNHYDLIDFDFSGSEFISTREDQDSLAFFCEKAIYDMVNYTISAEGVKIIRVADAAVFPGDGKVNIFENAVMETLKDAYIIADTSNKYHYFYDATVNIYSRHNYAAKGSYDYADMNNTLQEISMSAIGVDQTGKTYALGEIPKGSVFFLSPNYYFHGDVRITAQRKNLRFNGYFRINQECFFAEENWAGFDTIVDPMNVVIPVRKRMYNTESQKVEVGLAHSGITNRMYPAFFVRKNSPTDQILISSAGILKYDIGRFRVGKSQRIENRERKSNLLELGTERCVLRGIGNIDLTINPWPVQIAALGKAEHFIIPDSTVLRSTLVLDFPFDDKLLEQIADSINFSSVPGVDLTRENYKLLLDTYLGEKKSGEIQNEIDLYGYIRKFPNELAHTLIFADVNLKWNPAESSYISYGKIGIGSILEEQVNKYVDGYIQIEKRKNADAINIYLEVSKNSWYFFSYRNNVMQAYSSDDNFNTQLREMDIKNRTTEFEENLPYEYVISTRRKQVDFVREMEELKERDKRR